MITKLKIAILMVALVFCRAAQGGIYVYDYSSGALNATIRDNDANGYQNSITVSSTVGTVSAVTVTLNVTGGFNGDLYGYLVHLNPGGQSSGFAVLMNRMGATIGNPDGNSDPGFNITLRNAAGTSINSANGSGSQITGTYAPESSLSSFDGSNANGSWTLFFADRSPGDESTLVSWNLEITAVPEPVTYALIIFGGLVAMRFVFGRLHQKKIINTGS